VEDIQNAWIQQNNVRWINQKVSEGGDRPKVESEHPIQFVSTPYYDVSKTTPSSQVFIDIPRPSEYNVQELLEFLRTLGKGHTSTPSECQSCKYYFGSSFLQCSVNPTRKVDEDCADFESASNVLGSDWKNGEAIEPMIYSELNQGLPIMMFDMHPTASATNSTSSITEENPLLD
jgi:hypothetical protein